MRHERLTQEETARIRYLHSVVKLNGAMIAARTGFSKGKVYRVLARTSRSERDADSKAA